MQQPIKPAHLAAQSALSKAKTRLQETTHAFRMEFDTPEAASRTLFVRGISFSAGKDEVEQAFEAVGPVRKCFLVQAKGEVKHKGYGYVQFALREDAAAAVQQIQGATLAGRKLKVTGWQIAQRHVKPVKLPFCRHLTEIFAAVCRSTMPLRGRRSPSASARPRSRARLASQRCSGRLYPPPRLLTPGQPRASRSRVQNPLRGELPASRRRRRCHQPPRPSSAWC